MINILKEKLKKLRKANSYIVGWTRYYLYYSKELLGFSLSWFLPKHIKEQFESRLISMHLVCYTEGSCLKCGCATPALQMASKACEDNCYPSFMDKITWEAFKDGEVIVRNEIKWYAHKTLNNHYEFCNNKKMGNKVY